MGTKNSTPKKPKSYNRTKYKPTNNGNNNNYLTGRYAPTQWASYQGVNFVHKGCTIITLENENGGTAISPLQVDVEPQTESRLHFKIHDPNNQRFEVPVNKDLSMFEKRAQKTMYDVVYKEKPFSLTVTRRSTGHVLFNTSKGKFHIEDEKLTISTEVHSQYVYGLGEHQKQFLIDTKQKHDFVFWARDQSPKEDSNLYGVHPFFIALEEDGNAYGVFLLNSSALEVKISPGYTDEYPAILSYTANGGILDFYIFTGPTPVEVIQQYQEVIGRPHLPPYWGLGFHLCRWGYQNTNELKKVIKRTRDSGIPYESQWTDIDMMDDKKVWTFKDNELKEIVKDLHDQGQRYVMIVDPGVSIADKDQPAYREGLADGIFIKHYDGSRPLAGRVWPGETVFPDFTHPKIYDYWLRNAQSLYNEIPFDGMWLDMNEPANFVSGCVEDCNLTESHSHDNPTFVPANLHGKVLYDKTICTSAKHYAGLHYDLHNLYGHMEMEVSEKVCNKLTGKRSLIISRSTFAGSGKFGGHWTGDNASQFDDLRYSISAVLDFNMFGIPLIGADIGGFWKSCSEELMIRWMQVGAFYPFMRNHNASQEYDGNEDQDPGAYSKEAQGIMADITKVRYSLLPYLYTLMWDNHTKGLPVVRSLFMLFPRDKQTYGIDEQFMWGKTLLFSPCMKQGVRKISAYFPFDVWYDFYDGSRLKKVGTFLNLHAPLNHSNIHIRGGSLLVTQTPACSTTWSRTKPFGLIIALSSQHTASGKLFWDDGESLDPVTSEQYNLIHFNVKDNRLESVVKRVGLKCEMRLKLVQVFGLYVQPDQVYVNGVQVPFSYDENKSVLQLNKMKVSLLSPLTINW